MTNFGTLAILALPKMPERQLRLLLALETVTARDGEWRTIETGVLARQAHLAVATVVKGRAELATAGRIEYRPGTGPDHPGRYRMLIDLKPPKNASRVKPTSDASRVKPTSDGSRVKPTNPARASRPNALGKPTTPDAVTSADASIALEPITLESSALPGTAADPYAILAGLDTGKRLAEFIIARIEANPRIRETPADYLLGLIGNGDRAVAELFRRARRAYADATAGACDRDGPGRYSDACRGGDGDRCVWSWCACACHCHGRRA